MAPSASKESAGQPGSSIDPPGVVNEQPELPTELVRGEEDPVTGLVSWSYKFNCMIGSDDDHFLDIMQKHYKANKRVRVSDDDEEALWKRPRPLPTGPPGAGEDGDVEGLGDTDAEEEREVPEEGVPLVHEHQPSWTEMVAEADEEEAQHVTEQQRLRIMNIPHGTAYEGSGPPKWRLDANGKFTSRLPPDYWLTRGSTQPAVAEVGSVALLTRQDELVASATEPSERMLRMLHSGHQAPGVRPRKRWAPMAAPAVIGLGVVASSTTPAYGFSAATYEASTYSFSTAVYEASTCISHVQLTAPAGVVTGWSFLWIAVFVISMIVAAFAVYTAWLFRYVGFRVSPKTNDVGMQTEWQWPAKKRIVKHHEITVAPQNVLTLPHGRCFHVHGCHHTRQPRSSSGVFLLREGLTSYRRCEVCLANRQPQPHDDGRQPQPRDEAYNRPRVWPALRAVTVVDYTVLLVDQEIISETILQFIGAHDHPRHVWSRARHWIGDGCGQSCGCCRAANEEDRGSGCEPCRDLWYFKGLNRSTRYRVSIYNGLWTKWA